MRNCSLRGAYCVQNDNAYATNKIFINMRVYKIIKNALLKTNVELVHNFFNEK